MKQTPLEIWQSRFSEHIGTTTRYLGRVLNSGLLVVLILAFLYGIYRYPDFVAWIPRHFPVEACLLFIYVLLLTLGRFRTLLKEADLMLLTPMEQRLEVYFRRAWRYNLFVQLLPIGGLWLATLPLYLSRVHTPWMPEPAYSAAALLLLVVLLKGWNLHSAWLALYLPSSHWRRGHAAARALLNGLWLAAFFYASPLWAAVPLLLTLLWQWSLDRNLVRRWLFPWNGLWEMEKRLQLRFYRFVRFFADVPGLPEEVSPRRWLIRLMPIRYRKENAYLYLFWRQFVRRRDHLGMVLRLVSLGLMGVLLLPQPIWSGAAGAIAILVHALQWRGFQRSLLGTAPPLLPLPPGAQKQALRTLARRLLALQAAATVLCLAWRWLASG